MKKKQIFISIICLVMGFSACSNPTASNNNSQNNNENNGNDNTGNLQKLTIGYLSNLMVDISGATGLGITKKQMSAGKNRNARSAAAGTAAAEKFYLVKTTVDFSHGNVEWDDTGLTNVTFKKKTTVDETVFIPQLDDDGNPVFDEEGNPVLELIENQTVTQDEIPAQVNKLYAYNTYTFIQFVPNNTDEIPDIRPDDLGTPDRDGYHTYDKCDYYNDDYHQSFVIENSTGNIYSLESGVYIETVHNGLLKLKDSPYIFDCRIKHNNELEIFSLFQNTAVSVHDYFKDKYGNNYIKNTSLDTIVTETNTVFFKEKTYMMAQNNGDVLFADGNLGTYWKTPADSDSMRIGASRIRIVGANLTYRLVSQTDYLEFDDDSFIKNKEWYIWKGDVLVVDTDTAEIKHYIECRLGGLWMNSSLYYRRMLYDTILIRDLYGTILPDKLPADKLYYYKFDFNSLPVSDEPYYFDISIDNYSASYAGRCQAFGEGLILLLENLDREKGGVTGPWTITTLNGQDEYTVILKEINGEKIPVAVKTSEYVAEEQKTVTLKPINR